MAKSEYEWPKKITLPKNYVALASKDFDRPLRLADKGNKTYDALYRAIGRAMTQWAMVEESLERIFVTLLSPEGIGASRVFGSVLSLRARTEMVDASANMELHRLGKHDLLKDLTTRTELIRQASGRRNDIAHGVPNKRSYGCFIEPPMSSPRQSDKHAILPKFRYNSGNVNDFAKKFTLLSIETHNFWGDIHNELKPFRRKR